jgi:hypothetical protein
MRSCGGLFWQFGHSVGHSQPRRIPGGLAYVQNIRDCRDLPYRTRDARGYGPDEVQFSDDQERKEPRDANLPSPKIGHHVEC